MNKASETISSGYSEYQQAYSLDNFIMQQPLTFIRSGRYEYDDGSKNMRNVNGYYWEKSTNSKKDARYLVFNYLNIFPLVYSLKALGLSVRCVVK